MRVARDEWRGDVRHVHEIAELADVSVATRPAYALAGVELRSTNGAAEDPRGDRRATTGSLHVDDRRSSSAPPGLADAFRSRGFPTERAELSFAEYEARAVTWTGSLDSMAGMRRQGSPLPADTRWFWPALARVAVDAGTTSVNVVRQSARSLAAPGDMNRPLATTTPKPETSSTVEIISESLRQLASVQSGIPNIYMEQAAIVAIIEGDLRLALNEALDAMAIAAVAASPNQAPGANIVVSVRTAITALRALGYAPDTLVARPHERRGPRHPRVRDLGRERRFRVPARAGRRRNLEPLAPREQGRDDADRHGQRRARPLVRGARQPRAVRGKRRPHEHLARPAGDARRRRRRAGRRSRPNRRELMPSPRRPRTAPASDRETEPTERAPRPPTSPSRPAVSLGQRTRSGVRGGRGRRR
jgi:hypothetical protein